jgi:hypothetical protein
MIASFVGYMYILGLRLIGCKVAPDEISWYQAILGDAVTTDSLVSIPSRPARALVGWIPPEQAVQLLSAASIPAGTATALVAAARQTSAETVKRMRRRYRAQGLWGLVDKRVLREVGPTSRRSD